MKRFLQVALYSGAVVLYFISSPNGLEQIKSWTSFVTNHSLGLNIAHHDITDAASSKSLPTSLEVIQTETTASPELQIDPYPEPDLTPIEPISPDASIEYIEIINSCGPHFEGVCVNARAEPSATSTRVAKLRNGIVLRIAETVESNGHTWYRVIFNELLRHPERVTTKWYVAADYTRLIRNEGPKLLTVRSTTTKSIVIDLSEQTLYAYEGETLFMEQKISTGLRDTPTPKGSYTIFRKTPSRYMQGPIEGVSTQYYDLPGVPWNLYFTSEGAVIHGAYWHTGFGKVYSHGCVNLPDDKAKELYIWADLGTKVTVRE
jgi:lipoprotein-anchoring transpeptidase ErfK/SrfK